ncbi:unnamed protein product [Urochloa humidicola]
MEKEEPAPDAKKRTTKEAPDKKQRWRRRHGLPPHTKPTAPKPKADHISGLPDAILGEIISLLPTKAGVRTQVLSSRWRNLWLSAPLNIDLVSLPGDAQVQASIISKILASHQAPARRFSMRVDHGAATVDAWLRSPALNNLQELELHGFPVRTWPSVPAFTFRFSATLQVVTISFCRLLDSMVEKIHFPQVRQLELDRVKISDGALHIIIAGCPSLEHLLFSGCIGLVCPRINSPSVRSICMTRGKLIIEDAPSLVMLIDLALPGWSNVSVVSAPRLETLGYLSYGDNDSKLVFGKTIIQNLCAVSFATVVYSVKVLAISTYDLSLDEVVNLMRCFPCLEKLYIVPCISTNKNLWRRKHRDFIRCSEIRLKTIVIKCYYGTKSQVNFASFFVLNANMLELMRFECQEDNDDPMFIAKQHRLLEVEKRASSGAQFCFITSRICHFYNRIHIEHVRDLSTSNPFECMC